ncbi:hypothetical protein GCM10007094_36050 [Pseudovibrio japonicus]|uniref:Lysozyme inhibitor LprI-like N-terminal domain-containing protein n=1 Tax=Pseudovibrio japonicus TaxID=366534 RepID=A0ABQ3ENE5_9HYPH|nr:lysozyme inhibitor LprI family protein [Pseudovibrio japonicus]GHB43415.1 hypothetical protein GCM10007094_36050 [Pseudovibrio japonicus]
MGSVPRLSCTLSVFLLLGTPLQAAQEPTNEQAAIVARCVEEQGLVYPAMACFGEVIDQCIGTQNQDSHMIYCSIQEYMVWDQRLNTTYTQIMKIASTEVKASLRSAQRAWIAFRDDTCSANALLFDGTDAGLIMAACMASQTAIRSLQLDQFLSDAQIQ